MAAVALTGGCGGESDQTESLLAEIDDIASCDEFEEFVNETEFGPDKVDPDDFSAEEEERITAALENRFEALGCEL